MPLSISKFPLKKSISNRLLAIVLILSLIAIVVSSFAVVTSLTAKESVPKKPQMQYETLSYSRVSNYAENFFQVWMMGDENSRGTLNDFYSTSPVTDLNADPAQISALNVSDLKVAPTDSGEILWTVTLGATVTPPGVTAASRLFYQVDVLQSGDSLTIAKLPVLVNNDRESVVAGNAYPTAVQTSSPLYQVAVNFSATYLTPQQHDSFGRYVTAEFEGEPMKDSPYTGAEVVGVFVTRGVVLEQVKPGDMVDVRIRVRASTSQSTYQTMDLTVRAVKQSNGQWLVDSLTPTLTEKATKRS